MQRMYPVTHSFTCIAPIGVLNYHTRSGHSAQGGISDQANTSLTTSIPVRWASHAAPPTYNTHWKARTFSGRLLEVLIGRLGDNALIGFEQVPGNTSHRSVLLKCCADLQSNAASNGAMTTCRYRPPLLCRIILVSYHITRVSMRSNLLLFALLPLRVTRLPHLCLRRISELSLSQPRGSTPVL